MPITTGVAFQLALHTADWNRQFPFLEGRTVAQGTGFAGQNRYVMQGIKEGFVPSEGTRMLPDNPASVVRKVFLAQAPRPANLLYVEAELYT